LVADGQLRTLMTGGSRIYYGVENKTALMTGVSTGFCAIGIYCFMYPVRDYLVSFCDHSSGLKAIWVKKGAKFKALCMDVKGHTIVGGPTAFPSSDLDGVLASEGFRIYEDDVVRTERLQNGMAFDEFQRGTMTNKVIESKRLKFAFVGINGTIPLDDFPYSKQKEMFDHFTAFFEKNLVVNSQAYFSAFAFNWMIITEALLSNTFQSMGLGVGFCLLVATVMTWNWVVAFLAVGTVVIIVVMAVAFICAMGWTLGVVEAIVLIVIVGISVDYSIHIAHAYKNAYATKEVTEGMDQAQLREEKCLVAVGSMGISLLSGMATSVGAAIFLWFCQVSFFRKFGQFLMITLVLSLIATLFFLIPLLLVCGPVGGRGRLPALPRWKKNDPEATNQVKATNAKAAPTNDDQEQQATAAVGEAATESVSAL